jgi:hypothetical protein
MDDTTSDTLDQTDEDVLTYTVSDDAIEAAHGGENVWNILRNSRADGQQLRLRRL